MEGLSTQLDKDLKTELECPVCMELMKPPITLCENGHNICSNCKPKLTECPTCRKPFLAVRNLALESFSRALVSADSSSANKGPPAPKQHKCPFANISKEDCSWVGPTADMKKHITAEHASRNDLHKSSEPFNVILTGLSSSNHYRKAILINEELFYIVWEIKEGNFYCVVFYVGPKKKSRKFTYRFSLNSEDGRKNISMSFLAKSVVVENLDNVLNPGECVLLHYETVIKFLNANKHLTCDFEITSCETIGVTATSDVESKSKSESHTYSRSESDDSSCKREFLGAINRDFLYVHERGRRSRSPNLFCRFGRLGRCGRGPRRGLFDRHHHFEHDIGGFPDERRFPDKLSRQSRSFTDLLDAKLYLSEYNDDIVDRNKESEIATKSGEKIKSNNSKLITPSTAKHSVKIKGGVPKSSSQTENKLVNETRPTSRTLTQPVHKSREDVENNPTKIHTMPVNKPRVVVEQNISMPLNKQHDVMDAAFPKSSTLPLDKMLEKREDDVPKSCSLPLDNKPETLMEYLFGRDLIPLDMASGKSKGVHQGESSSKSPLVIDGWKCVLCGFFVPKNQKAQQNLITYGSTWKCNLCGHWRPKQ